MNARSVGLRRAAVAALLAIVLGLLGAAPAGARSNEVRMHFSLDPEFKVTARSTAIHVKVEQRGCGPTYERPRVRRTASRVTITLIGRPPSPPPGPGVACPQYIAEIPVTVKIGGPLAHRAVFDGAWSPPREVAPAP